MSKMAIKKIRVKNYKSFRDIDVNLGKFNILIGANASGKSNFVEVFRFLRDIVSSGLENAVSLQGGIEYLRNVNVNNSQDISLYIESDYPMNALKKTKKGLIGIKIYETQYSMTLTYKKKGLDFSVIEDVLKHKCDLFQMEEKKKGELEEKEKIGSGTIVYSNENGKITVEVKPKKFLLKEDDVFPPFLKDITIGSTQSLLEFPFLFPPTMEANFSETSIYDFDPKIPKKATPITGKAELEEDGANLSIILKNIIKNKDSKRKLFNLVRDILPYIDDLDVEKFADKSLLFKLRETYNPKQYLPASLISDGTVNITALLIALYFEKKKLTIIEEPERRIHPHILSKLIQMMRDASKKKQIIITTHNPEIVKHTKLDEILLAARDQDGFSTITRPSDNEQVKIFLQNEMGIEDLYIQNLLEV